MFDVATAIKVLSTFAKFAGSAISLKERRLLQDVNQKLAAVYFFDNRTMALLNKISSGEAISSEAVERAMMGFEMSENPVRDALRLLTDFEDERGAKLGIEVRNDLRNLANNKMDVRLAVWDFLHSLAENSHNESFRKSHRDKARGLVTLIENLNAQILRIDEALRKQG